MNNSVYEEYMRSVLGYEPIKQPFQNTYEESQNNMFYDDMMNYGNNYNNFSNGFNNSWNDSNSELEQYYPDIYVMLKPMVEKACKQNTNPITKQLIDDMAEEIYFAIEPNEAVMDRGLEESKKVEEIKDYKKTNPARESKNIVEKETREDRQIIRNRTLNDLIKIMLLNQLIGRPRPGVGARPPFGPRPPIGGRPPFGPRPMPFNRNIDMYNYNLFD